VEASSEGIPAITLAVEEHHNAEQLELPLYLLAATSLRSGANFEKSRTLAENSDSMTAPTTKEGDHREGSEG
jgi:hypothetical protein